MLNKIKEWFKPKKEIILVKRSSLPMESIEKLEKDTGRTVIEVDDMADVRLLERESEGDGKAIFIPEGSIEDFKEQKNEDEGRKGIFGL
jgi:hypothetical protein